MVRPQIPTPTSSQLGPRGAFSLSGPSQTQMPLSLYLLPGCRTPLFLPLDLYCTVHSYLKDNSEPGLSCRPDSPIGHSEPSTPPRDQCRWPYSAVWIVLAVQAGGQTEYKGAMIPLISSPTVISARCGTLVASTAPHRTHTTSHPRLFLPTTLTSSSFLAYLSA